MAKSKTMWLTQKHIGYLWEIRSIAKANGIYYYWEIMGYVIYGYMDI
jgi:hypothetical protein